MKLTLMASLCLLIAPQAFASEDFILNARVSATQCQDINGVNVCSSTFEPQTKNIVVPLSECDPVGAGQICFGKWEGVRDIAGKALHVKMQVQKTTFPGFENGVLITYYQLTASVQMENGKWAYLTINTGAGGSLTDSVKIDGEDYKFDPHVTVTPALEVGPAL